MSSKVVLSEVITDISAGPFGSNLKVACFVDKGFPIIDGANLKGYKVTDNLTKFVTEEKARSLHRSIAKRGEVVVTISGTLGQIAYIPDNSEYSEYLCSQRQFRVAFDPTRVYVPYLVFYFHTREGQGKILSFANQTGVPALAQPTKNFQNIEIDLPDLATQRRIANYGEILLKKIELNSQINDYLAEIGEALVANLEANTALGDVCGFVGNKRNIDSIQIDEYVSTESLLQNRRGRQRASSIPESGKVTSFEIGDVLISNIRPYFQKIWRASFHGGCSNDVLVFRSNDTSYASCLYFVLRRSEFFDFVMRGAKGTKMPRGDKKRMLGYLVPGSIDGNSAMLLNYIVEQMSFNSIESERLVELKDALLPKLMSGEIDVSQVDLTPLNNHLSGR